MGRQSGRTLGEDHAELAKISFKEANQNGGPGPGFASYRAWEDDLARGGRFRETHLGEDFSSLVDIVAFSFAVGGEERGRSFVEAEALD